MKEVLDSTKMLLLEGPLLQNNLEEVNAQVDLSPKLCKKVYGSDGGSYYAWSPSDLPMLEKASIAASKLSLLKNGLSLPSYSDSAKVAYVIQGSGTAGIALHEAEKEKVILIKTGDSIPLPIGVVTWWYNADDTELIVLFLGETSKAHKVGEFTHFALTGSKGIFTGFSTEVVGRAYDLEEDKVKELVGSQKESGIIKLAEGTSMPGPKKEDRDGMALNCLEAPLDVDVNNGGRVVVLNTKNLPLVGEVGLGAALVRLDKGAMYCSPGFSCDSAFQVTYIIRGSGRCQVVGVDGRRVLETRLEAGYLFIVPRFFVVSKIADGEGLEWFSIFSTPNPIFTNLAGKTSIWKALSPEVLAASFNVSMDVVEKLFRSKRTALFFPPPEDELEERQEEEAEERLKLEVVRAYRERPSSTTRGKLKDYLISKGWGIKKVPKATKKKDGNPGVKEEHRYTSPAPYNKTYNCLPPVCDFLTEEQGGTAAPTEEPGTSAPTGTAAPTEESGTAAAAPIKVTWSITDLRSNTL